MLSEMVNSGKVKSSEVHQTDSVSPNEMDVGTAVSSVGRKRKKESKLIVKQCFHSRKLKKSYSFDFLPRRL